MFVDTGYDPYTSYWYDGYYGDRHEPDESYSKVTRTKTVRDDDGTERTITTIVVKDNDEVKEYKREEIKIGNTVEVRESGDASIYNAPAIKDNPRKKMKLPESTEACAVDAVIQQDDDDPVIVKPTVTSE